MDEERICIDEGGEECPRYKKNKVEISFFFCKQATIFSVSVTFRSPCLTGDMNLSKKELEKAEQIDSMTYVFDVHPDVSKLI